MKKSFLLLAASYFACYPTEQTIFITEDEQAFFSENDATNHAKSLRKKESDEPVVISISREEAEAAASGEAPAIDTAPVTALTKENAQANVEKAKAAIEPLKAAWENFKAKLDGAPDNKNFQKWEARAKAAYEKALQDVADAQAALDSFTEAEKN
jgi:hypothetical protein